LHFLRSSSSGSSSEKLVVRVNSALRVDAYRFFSLADACLPACSDPPRTFWS